LFRISLWLHEEFVSYMVDVIIAGDKAGNLDTSMVLVAFFI
jgi:hypothetical protein